jgi:UDP-N-acetylglucosamine:LPS N-acetylglucosamine transferase
MQLLERASLLVCHGGQLSVFEALSQQIPVAVMPFQPEQAQNGVCLEQLGCGQRLVPGQSFLGRSEVYSEAFNQRSDKALKESLLSLGGNRDALAYVSNLLASYKGNEVIFRLLESPT